MWDVDPGSGQLEWKPAAQLISGKLAMFLNDYIIGIEAAEFSRGVWREWRLWRYPKKANNAKKIRLGKRQRCPKLPAAEKKSEKPELCEWAPRPGDRLGYRRD